MNRLVDQEFERALASIDIESYLDAEGIDYRESYGTRGRQLNLRECPACGEGGFKTYINAESGLGNCFHGACGKKFNRFWLLKSVSGMGGADFSAYVKATAENLGWIPRKEKAKLVQADLKLPSKCHPLPINGCNLLYLEERGITAETAAEFGLQFCQNGWWGYKLDDGTEKWVSYNDRVIIPIFDMSGKRMVSFQGRDITGEQQPKYLFPVGYAVAGQELYGAWRFKQGLHKHAIVGEGVFDALAIHQAVKPDPQDRRPMFNDSVYDLRRMLPLATFGMHLSEGPNGQIAKFAELRDRGLETVTFMWDGEKKALKAAVEAALKLRAIGLATRVARLPAGKDPNEVGPSVVIDAIQDAQVISRASALRILTMLGLSHS